MSPFEKSNELLARGAPPIYAKYPPELHLRLMEATSLAEIKVVLYVFWYTYKFKEWGEMKALTLDEFQHGRKERGKRADNGVGLARKNIIAGIKAAVKHHLLYEIVDDRDKARITKYYAIAFWHTDEPEVTIRNPQEAESGEEAEKDESEGTKSDPRGNESLPHPVTIRNPGSHESLPRSEIETPDRDVKIDTSDRNRAATPPAFIDVKEKEEDKDTTPPALSPAEQQETAEQGRQRLKEEAARTAELEKKQAAKAAAQAAYKALYPEFVRLSADWSKLVDVVKKAEPGSLEYDRASAEAEAYKRRVDEMREQLRSLKKAEEG